MVLYNFLYVLSYCKCTVLAGTLGTLVVLLYEVYLWLPEVMVVRPDFHWRCLSKFLPCYPAWILLPISMIIILKRSLYWVVWTLNQYLETIPPQSSLIPDSVKYTKQFKWKLVIWVSLFETTFSELSFKVHNKKLTSNFCYKVSLNLSTVEPLLPSKEMGLETSHPFRTLPIPINL